MSGMSYRNYLARVEYDANDRIFVGQIAGINDIVGFHGESVAELEAAFHDAVDDYVEACAKINKPPEKPYSGRVMFRVNPATHARAALAAQMSGLSLNQWAEQAMDRQAEADLVGTVG
jgi:predicted HicB family RNase H-like nuclease